MSSVKRKCALLIIDMQYDFCPPNGSLAVNDGLAVIPVINRLRSAVKWDYIALTKDWHPQNHVSFFSNHKDNPNAKLFTELTLENGSKQMMWPDHCVQESPGSELHKDLVVEDSDAIVYKGTNPIYDSYSGFFDNEHKNQTEMTDLLRKQGITDVYVTGLAYDYCVGFTAIDAMEQGFNTFVVHDATRGVAPETTTAMIQRLKDNNIRIVTSDEVIKNRTGPRAEVSDYLAKHNVIGLFESLAAAIVVNKPDDVQQFIISELEKIRDARARGADAKDTTSSAAAKNQVALFSTQDIDTAFGLLDPLKSGKITGRHVKSMLPRFGIRPGAVEVNVKASYDVEAFRSKILQGLAAN
eukprot:TRINITY_DN85054_c0_g1_i1.p1 TRINITY_DN85054_c0_g1~~TRINITY_DN85054_c0_g1_i1.p1  ORF type:complete len:354 (-),score=188.68 TRINITY_DN85054_c0_g1_i1:82-1143(-)